MKKYNDRCNELFEDLFVLELANNHWGDLKRGYKIIDELANQGNAILLISSELNEVLSMSDRIYVMHEGKIKGEYQKNEFNAEKIASVSAGIV